MADNDDDYNFDEYYGFVKPQQEFELEYNAYDRIAYLEHDVLSELNIHGIDTQFRKKDIIYDPIKRFTVYVIITAKKIFPNINSRNLSLMVEQIKHIKHIQYKNPHGYVIGFYITSKGNIDKEKFTDVQKQIKLLDIKISTVDIIRYCNMCLNLHK